MLVWYTVPYDDTTAYVRHDVVKDLFDKTREDGAKLDNKFKALCAEKEVNVQFWLAIIS